MWIEDLTKALYFLNATEYRCSVLIDKIENNAIKFSNGRYVNVKTLTNCYDHYIETGEIVKLW